MATSSLPKGIYFEAARSRYRVRLWRNKRMYISYHATLLEAEQAHAALKALIVRVPKRPRSDAAQAPVPVTSMRGLIKAVNKH